jgi:hypothetical protein
MRRVILAVCLCCALPLAVFAGVGSSAADARDVGATKVRSPLASHSLRASLERSLQRAHVLRTTRSLLTPSAPPIRVRSPLASRSVRAMGLDRSLRNAPVLRNTRWRHNFSKGPVRSRASAAEPARYYPSFCPAFTAEACGGATKRTYPAGAQSKWAVLVYAGARPGTTAQLVILDRGYKQILAKSSPVRLKTSAGGQGWCCGTPKPGPVAVTFLFNGKAARYAWKIAFR